MSRGCAPTFNLERVRQLVARNAYRVTRTALQGAAALYLDETDIVECICALTPDDFYKSMQSTNRPGTFQDVYLPPFHGFALYVKIQLWNEEQVVIISFKQNESA